MPVPPAGFGSDFSTNAEVVIGNVGSQQYTPSSFILPDGDPLQVFTDYMVSNRYEKDGHVYLLPISSPTPFNGQSCAFVQLAAPTLVWIADWTACCWTKQPQIPDPTPNSSNWVLLDEHYEPGMLEMGPDAFSPLYRISGTYFYGCVNPNATTVNDIQFGRPPYISPTVDRSVPTSTLKQNLINKTLQTPSGPGFPVGS